MSEPTPELGKLVKALFQEESGEYKRLHHVQLADLEANNVRLNAEILQVKSENHRLDIENLRINNELRCNDAELIRVSALVDCSTADIEHLKDQLRRKDAEILGIGAVVDRSTADIERLKDQLRRKDAEILRISAVVNRNTADIEHLKDQLHRKDAETLRTRNMTDRNTADIERLVAEYNRSAEHRKEAVNKLRQLRILHEDNVLNSTNGPFMKSEDFEASVYAALESTLQSLSAEKRKLKNLSQTRGEGRGKNKVLLNRFDALNDSVAELREELDRVRQYIGDQEPSYGNSQENEFAIKQEPDEDNDMEALRSLEEAYPITHYTQDGICVTHDVPFPCRLCAP